MPETGSHDIHLMFPTRLSSRNCTLSKVLDEQAANKEAMADAANDWQCVKRAAGHHNVASHDISTYSPELTQMNAQRPCSLSSYPPPGPLYWLVHISL